MTLCYHNVCILQVIKQMSQVSQFVLWLMVSFVLLDMLVVVLSLAVTVLVGVMRANAQVSE